MGVECADLGIDDVETGRGEEVQDVGAVAVVGDEEVRAVGFLDAGQLEDGADVFVETGSGRGEPAGVGFGQ